ncbi:MAG: metallophosphoesterase family protein [Candidatus Sumerlaeaceae bacterium]
MKPENSGEATTSRPETVLMEPAHCRVVLHCSDIHVGRRFQPQPAEGLMRAAKRIAPDAVIVSGDLTMRARQGQFRQARALLDRLPHPMVVIPGNHDIPLYNLPMRLLIPFANYNRWIAELDDGVLNLGVCAVWAVNTINPFVHQKGRILEQDLEAIERWSGSLPPDLWRVLVVHQHFANTPDNPRPGIYRHARELLARLARAGVHLVLHGHVHQSGFHLASELFAEFPHPMVVAAAGTVSSGRTRGGERLYQFNLLTFEYEKFSVQIWNWNAARGEFEAGEWREFPRAMFS